MKHQIKKNYASAEFTVYHSIEHGSLVSDSVQEVWLIWKVVSPVDPRRAINCEQSGAMCFAPPDHRTLRTLVYFLVVFT